MMNLAKTDLDGFSRDLTSKAVINTNVEHIRKYKEEREAKLKLMSVQERQQHMSDEIDGMKQDLNDIKSLLQEISKRL
jgi:hypothetical protein